jgi:hypothetical protein
MVWNMPGSLDGVYFLGVGFDECVKMQAGISLPRAEFRNRNPAPDQDDTAVLLWNESNSKLQCLQEDEE